MRRYCAWCEGEGTAELLGEKEPLDDQRETHGICDMHQRALLDTLQVRSATTAS